jgi:hypothetical protein
VRVSKGRRYRIGILVHSPHLLGADPDAAIRHALEDIGFSGVLMTPSILGTDPVFTALHTYAPGFLDAPRIVDADWMREGGELRDDEGSFDIIASRDIGAGQGGGVAPGDVVTATATRPPAEYSYEARYGISPGRAVACLVGAAALAVGARLAFTQLAAPPARRRSAR